MNNYLSHLKYCSICRYYVALNMVEPIKGFSTALDDTIRNKRQKTALEVYEKKHKKVLIKHGSLYEYSMMIIRE